jgi:hypothetical protein
MGQQQNGGNGDGLQFALQAALFFMPPESRLQIARRLRAYLDEVERDALASLGGEPPAEPEQATVDTEGESR